MPLWQLFQYSVRVWPKKNKNLSFFWWKNLWKILCSPQTLELACGFRSWTYWKWLCAMNDYGLMRRESDSNKAPQDNQTDWLAGGARHFLSLKRYFLHFHFNHQQPPGRHQAHSLGGRSQAPSLPTAVSIARCSLTPLSCYSLSHLWGTMQSLHAAQSPSFPSSISNLSISAVLPPSPSANTSLSFSTRR